MKYGTHIVKKICKLIASDDYTNAEICTIVGISEETFYTWKKDESKPEFSEALQKAGEKRLDTFKKAARSGLLTLLQGKEYEEETTEYKADRSGKPQVSFKKRVRKFILPNPTSVIFTLKNLDGDNFKDIMKSEVDHTTKGEPIRPVDLSHLSVEDLMRLKYGPAGEDQKAD